MVCKLSILSSSAHVCQAKGKVMSKELWSKTAWFSSLDISSPHMVVIPVFLSPCLGHISWVLVDLATRDVVDFAMSTKEQYSKGENEALTSAADPDSFLVSQPLLRPIIATNRPHAQWSFQGNNDEATP